LTQVVDSLGRNITYTYRADGRLQEVRDFAGRPITFSYTPAARPGDGDVLS
jgi:YD repeat-containing protein